MSVDLIGSTGCVNASSHCPHSGILVGLHLSWSLLPGIPSPCDTQAVLFLVEFSMEPCSFFFWWTYIFIWFRVVVICFSKNTSLKTNLEKKSKFKKNTLWAPDSCRADGATNIYIYIYMYVCICICFSSQTPFGEHV